MAEKLNNTMKGWFIGLLLFFLCMLYLGGSICAMIAIAKTQQIVPIVATGVVILYGIPALVRIVKLLFGD